MINEETVGSIIGSEVRICYPEGNQIVYSRHCDLPHTVIKKNIYEFAFDDCIEWAAKNGYIIRPHKRGEQYVAKVGFGDDKHALQFVDEAIYGSVFKACDWIQNKIQFGKGESND